MIHSTLVAGSAKSPLPAKDPIEVRVLDTVMGQKGQFRYSDQWTLAEWTIDFATQACRLFINGEEVKEVAFSKGAGNFAEAEIPEVFESLSFGWNNYQQVGKGVVAWIDDLPLAKDRLGARGIPVPKKKS